MKLINLDLDAFKQISKTHQISIYNLDTHLIVIAESEISEAYTLKTARRNQPKQFKTYDAAINQLLKIGVKIVGIE